MKNRTFFLNHYSRLLTAVFIQMQSNTQAVNLSEVVDLFTENMTPDEVTQVTEPLLDAILKSAEKFGKDHRSAIAWLFDKANTLLPQLAEKGTDAEILKNYGKKYLAYNPGRAESDNDYYTLRSTVHSLSNKPKNSFSISSLLKSKMDFINSYETFFLNYAGMALFEEQKIFFPGMLETNILKILNLYNILGNRLFETSLSIDELDEFLKKYEPVNKKYFPALEYLFKKYDTLDKCTSSLSEFSHFFELYAQLKSVKKIGEPNIVEIYIGGNAPKGPLPLHEKLKNLVKSGATLDATQDFVRNAVREAYEEASANPTLVKLAQDKPLDEDYGWCHEYRLEKVMEDDNYDLIVTMLAVQLHLEDQAVRHKLHESKARYRNRLFGMPAEKSDAPAAETDEQKDESNNNDFDAFLRKVM